MTPARRTPPTRRSPSQERDYALLAEVVREKLVALGDFAHLRVRRQAEHVLVEQPGPPDAPDEHDPVLRLTPIGGFRFGLSVYDHNGRWRKIPISGVVADVLTQAVAMFGPLLAPEENTSATSETDY